LLILFIEIHYYPGIRFFTGTSKMLKRSKFAGDDGQENTSHDEAAGLISEAPALNNVLLSFNTYPAR